MYLSENAANMLLLFYEDDIFEINDSMQTDMEKFDVTQCWHLPVLTQDKRLAGFISKTKLFAKYREILSSQNDLMSDV